MKIAASAVRDIVGDPDFTSLAAEYAEECAVPGLPLMAPRMEAYRHLEAAGILHSFAARKDGVLAGFISVLLTVLPHYGVGAAVAETFFVGQAHRASRAGLGLLRAAEQKTRDAGAAGLLVSAPYGGRLFELLPLRGYAETNRIFFKRASDA